MDGLLSSSRTDAVHCNSDVTASARSSRNRSQLEEMALVARSLIFTIRKQFQFSRKKKEKQRLNTQYTPELRDAIYPSAPSFSTLLTLGGRELYPNIQALGMGAYVCLGGSFLQNYRIELQQHAGELVVACYQQKF